MNWREELPLFLEREAFLANTDAIPNDVYLWVPDHLGEAIESCSRWKFNYLQPSAVSGIVPEIDRCFAMYMN